VQNRYLNHLDSLDLWDIQTARLKAIELKEVKTSSEIILLGTVDLNNTLRQMLDQVAQSVTAFIIAPEELADRFDAHGCLIPEEWTDTFVPLKDDQLQMADGPSEQAEAVTRWLEELARQYQADEVVIGVPDEKLAPDIQRQLAQCHVKARWVEGRHIGETGPYRLLAAAVRYAATHGYDDLAALIRHPDLAEWLESKKPKENGKPQEQMPSLPAQLDEFYNQNLPRKLQADQVYYDSYLPTLEKSLRRIEDWLQPATEQQELRDWGDIFRGLLAKIYGRKTLILENEEENLLHGVIRKILEELRKLDGLPESLDKERLGAPDAFQIILGPLANDFLPPPADSEAVEILGWLELPLDDSKALVVTSFNEGFVPKSAGADAFLPDQLRRELNLMHNDRRYARDAYATSVLCHSRESLRMISARKDTNKDPLAPSRLLFACDDNALVRRTQAYYASPSSALARGGNSRRLLLAPANGIIPRESKFKIPGAKLGKSLERISVTRFK
jgi:hypothetical protein